MHLFPPRHNSDKSDRCSRLIEKVEIFRKFNKKRFSAIGFRRKITKFAA